MENKNKIKYNDVEFLLSNNKLSNRNAINAGQITVKKMTFVENVKETASNILNKTKKVINFVFKPFSTIIKAIKKSFKERKDKKEKIKSQKEKIKSQKELNNFFEKKYGANTGRIKSIIEKLETKYHDNETDFEILRKKNVKEINAIKHHHKSPTLVDPDTILEHNSEDNTGKPELKDLIAKDNLVATEILTATPKSKKLKAKTKILVKTQI